MERIDEIGYVQLNERIAQRAKVIEAKITEPQARYIRYLRCDRFMSYTHIPERMLAKFQELPFSLELESLYCEGKAICIASQKKLNCNNNNW